MLLIEIGVSYKTQPDVAVVFGHDHVHNFHNLLLTGRDPAAHGRGAVHDKHQIKVPVKRSSAGILDDVEIRMQSWKIIGQLIPHNLLMRKLDRLWSNRSLCAHRNPII